jgi:hypothetical protein
VYSRRWEFCNSGSITSSSSCLRERHIHIDHLEIPEALQALDNLASDDAFDAFGDFQPKVGG